MSYSEFRRERAMAAQEFLSIPPATLAQMIEDEGKAIAADEHAGRRHGAFRQQAMEHCLAVRFGHERGWTLAQKPFGLVTLQRGKRHSGGRSDDEGNGYFRGDIATYFDHPYWYRRRGRAAALVAHLYCLPDPENQKRCEEIAARFGCVFETPDFPSWWNPSGTVLVAYIGPAGR